ncbi:Purine nucleoside phosphoramidase [bacterium HR30]|nr:Purine nucleoside phosphoramidase [bacterium HR30]
MQSCVFCKIIRQEAPAHRVYEDDRVIAFLDIFPVSEGHTLVVTKKHYVDLFEADSESLQAVAAIAQKVAHALREVVRPQGLMVFQLNGAAAGQTVFHYHMHLMPRAEGEPLRLHARQPGDPQRLAELAAKLRACLRSE